MTETAKKEITANQVADYLRAHPDFFTRHPDLLTDLQFSHDSGKAVSLIERQVDLLRREQRTALEQIDSILGEATANEKLLKTFQGLVTDMVATQSVESMLENLQSALTNNFSLQSVCILLPESLAANNWPGVRYVADKELAAIEQDTYRLDTYVGRIPAPLRSRLQLEDEKFRSIALLKLQTSQPCWLLLASEDERRFESNMATDFIEFLAAVLGAILGRHL